jgi:hypothetical protein
MPKKSTPVPLMAQSSGSNRSVLCRKTIVRRKDGHGGGRRRYECRAVFANPTAFLSRPNHLFRSNPGVELVPGHVADTVRGAVLIHIPEPNKHLVHFYGTYANRVRSTYRKDTTASDETQATPSRCAVNKRWAELIYRIYEVAPLTCPRCDSSMKLLAFITEPTVIRAILDHLDANAHERAPPTSGTGSAH